MSCSQSELAKLVEEYVKAGATDFVLSFRDVRLFQDDNIDSIVSFTRGFAETTLKSFR